MQEYVNISKISDAAMDEIGQIPLGQHNGFHLRPKCP